MNNRRLAEKRSRTTCPRCTPSSAWNDGPRPPSTPRGSPAGTIAPASLTRPRRYRPLPAACDLPARSSRRSPPSSRCEARQRHDQAQVGRLIPAPARPPGSQAGQSDLEQGGRGSDQCAVAKHRVCPCEPGVSRSRSGTFAELPPTCSEVTIRSGLSGPAGRCGRGRNVT
jgi:hypothetical protein